MGLIPKFTGWRLHQRIEDLEVENERLRATLLRIAGWPDANMATAKTLHYDFRGMARDAIRPPLAR